jgi:chromosome segregation ATPase
MKIKVVIFVLVVACIGLAIALFTIKKQAEDQHAEDLHAIGQFSNDVISADAQLKEKDQVNLTLSNQLAVSQQQLAQTQEQMSQLSNSLLAANSTLAETRTSLDTAKEAVTNLNARINDLEAQNKFLDEQASSLSNSLVRLTQQIEDTKNQLAVSETNASFLQGELQKQLAQKAELEHRFNDVDELRAQVKRLKDEMFVARRVQLMKNDVGTKKGAQLLMMRTLPAPSATPPPKVPTSHYDLNVEIGSDGSVKVIPPLGHTNSPAH